MIAVGLMSGTSLDGIDAALVRIEPRAAGYALETLGARTFPFEGAFADRLRAALPPATPNPGYVAALDADLGALLGDATRAVAGGARIDFVASHGVTLFHDGDRSLTTQIGDPFAIRERAGASVLYDFRRADCAAGGHGAPLVPYADALLFSATDEFRVAINLGGIANVTLLPPGAEPCDVTAWDVGPANMLIDALVRSRTDGARVRDEDGALGVNGRVDRAALEVLLRDPYFARDPPKSTGREHFGEPFLAAHAGVLEGLSLEDGCATLAELTAQTLAHALVSRVPPGGHAIVSGGGVHNRTIMSALASALRGFIVASAAGFGVDPDFKEAVAFAILGYELLRERPAGLPNVTGARHPTLLGAIAPAQLTRLLAAVREELER